MLENGVAIKKSLAYKTTKTLFNMQFKCMFPIHLFSFIPSPMHEHCTGNTDKGNGFEFCSIVHFINHALFRNC